MGDTIRLLLMLALAGLLSGASARAQRFLPDDPLWADDDRVPIPKPYERDLSQVADFMVNTFATRPEEGEPIPPAENVDTLGGVPDSSWFTNRIGRRAMSLEELALGPNRGDGPAAGPWTIIAAKSQGVSPGFTIRDQAGDVYFIKFDPRGHPQLATSSEVIATRFFHAFGYHVPQNYLSTVRPADLQISSTAMVTDEFGRRRQMRRRDLEEILRKVARRPDGQIQALASLALEGSPLGPFRYFGTRPDDANDIFPHENRRELRGLRVFASWLNHDDARSINSLDMFVARGEMGYVRHHLIDFGSCLGSGSVKPQSRRAGNEYILEWSPIVKAGLTLGIWERPWRKVRYRDLLGVGRFEGDYFEPEKWKPEYPNPAFERMLPADAFWAARIVQRFTRPAVEALVATGRLSSGESERYLVETLLKRQAKIVRYHLSRLNPLDGFRVEGGRLLFDNAGLEAALTSSASYRYRWHHFDNRSGETSPIGGAASTGQPVLPLPGSEAPWLMVEISTEAAVAAWSKPVRVYLRNQTGWKVIGIERGE